MLPMSTIVSHALTSHRINIPRLALNAANELDDVERGLREESPSAEQLRLVLINSFGNGKAATEITATSGTVAVVCNALELLRTGKKINDLGELVTIAKKYAEQLNGTKITGGKSTIVTAKNFCIALAKAAASYRESVVGVQARNRWR